MILKAPQIRTLKAFGSYRSGLTTDCISSALWPTQHNTVAGRLRRLRGKGLVRSRKTVKKGETRGALLWYITAKGKRVLKAQEAE
jgi:hypothetical protein